MSINDGAGEQTLRMSCCQSATCSVKEHDECHAVLQSTFLAFRAAHKLGVGEVML